MRKTSGILLIAALLGAVATGHAQQAGGQKDVFKGKLFAPNVILEHQQALGLSREQYTAIREAVVDTQASVAGDEWDLREAYQAVLAALDEDPVDSERVLELVEVALAAENSVKKKQVGLLIRLRNLLTDEQLAKLRRMTGY